MGEEEEEAAISSGGGGRPLKALLSYQIKGFRLLLESGKKGRKDGGRKRWRGKEAMARLSKY